MGRLEIDIMGISETWWKESGVEEVGDFTLYYSGNDANQHRKGVGIILSKQYVRCVMECVPLSDRMMMIKLKGSPLNVNLIQVYAPTADSDEDEIESFYHNLKQLLKSTKQHEITLIIGDFNAKVGSEKTTGVTGAFGLGERNDRGSRLVQFCQEERYKISNTCFSLPPRRLYTWKSPQDSINGSIVRNQIDYILINHRFSSSIKSVTTYPGADLSTDHSLLMARISLKLAINKINNIPAKLNLNKLNDEAVKKELADGINNKIRDIMSEVEHPIELWNAAAKSITDIAKEKLGVAKKEKKQEWITDEILQIMEDRRKQRGINDTEYKRLHKLLKRKIRDAKNEWLLKQCEELEHLQAIHDDFNLHKKLKELNNCKHKTSSNILFNEQNEIVTEADMKKEIWATYVKELFEDDTRANNIEATNLDDGGPIITESEIRYAIKVSKNKKACGCDNLPAELLKLIDEDGIKVLLKVFNYIYKTGEYPSNWLKSTFVALPKKNKPKVCKDYRLISLMSHSLKIFLRIIHQRLYQKCEEAMGRMQFGFKKAMGTREALFGVKILVQNCQDANRDVCLCFIDYEKAFDRVKHAKMIEILRSMNVDENDIRCIQNLYWNQTATVRIGDLETEEIPINRGVRQGCILSPLLFNIYSEKIFEEAINSMEKGIKVNGQFINNVRYADDTTLMAHTVEDLQELVDAVANHSQNFGLNINVAKTKYMIISKTTSTQNSNITVNGANVEKVTRFKYLGCQLNDKWDCDNEVRCRIEMARSAFMKFKKTLTSCDINIKLRLRFVKCYVWSVLLYGSETWTLKVVSMNRLEAFEMWCYRRLLKISWTERVTNEAVLQRLNKERELLLTIKKRKTSYLGHVIRGEKYEVLQLILQGKIEGRRGIGRKQYSWLRNIRNWTGLRTVGELINCARNREHFTQVINNIA